MSRYMDDAERWRKLAYDAIECLEIVSDGWVAHPDDEQAVKDDCERLRALAQELEEV